MERESLERLLLAGLSVERIANRFGKHPSTVSYWMTKYGLEAPHRERHAARGGVERERLEELVAEGLSIVAMAERLERSPGTVRHWLKAYGLETARSERLRRGRLAKASGVATMLMTCRHHGETEFSIEGRGTYRCLRCRQESVVRRRRAVKAALVAEAGGACALCGYDRCAGALHFHHVNPHEKAFALSGLGLARSITRARAEANKCVLLCSNCHAEVENGVSALPVQYEAEPSIDRDPL